MSIQIDCFKAYDIRGRIPDQLNADVAYRVGNATAEFLDTKRVVLGRDIRESSDELATAVAQGLMDAGVDVSVLSALMGHRSPRETGVYLHSLPGRTREAVNRISRKGKKS